MTRVHPQFLMNGMKKAWEAENFEEFNKEVAKGLEYWTNLLNKEIGTLDPNELPLIIAALNELASAYEKLEPHAANIAESIRKAVKSQIFVTKHPK